MDQPTLKTLKRLFAVSRNQCSFPGCCLPIIENDGDGTVTGIICHINARSKGGPRFDAKQSAKKRHSFENLILLCSRHSKIIDSNPKRYPASMLREIKADHETQGFVEVSPKDAKAADRLTEEYNFIYVSGSASVNIDKVDTVKAKTVNFKSSQRPRVSPPEGSIASSLEHRNYVKHLIDRYLDFASKQEGRQFKHPAFYSKIKSVYGAKWDMIPISQFDSLVEYLQKRIDGTLIGRKNSHRSYPNYSSFEAFLEKFGQR